MTRWLCVLLALAGLAPASAAKNQAAQTLVYPCRQAAGPIVVDGKLDAVEWAGAVVAGGLRNSGAEKLAPQQTAMRLLYDRERLYLGVVCYEPQMASLKTSATQHDGAFWEDDSIEFFLDSRHDHETYWQFAATARATRYENRQADSMWDCDWEAQAQRGPDAWTLEMAVPFAGLGVPAPSGGSLWGFNLCRERQAGGRLELHNWADVQRVFANPPRFGHLFFAPAGWQMDEAGVSAAARGAGGSEALVNAEDGTWRVRPGRAPELRTYRALLAGHSGRFTKRLEELRRIYRESTQMALREEFERLDAGYGRVVAMGTGDAPVGAEAWATAEGFLDGFQEGLDALYWRVRLAALNETM